MNLFKRIQPSSAATGNQPALAEMVLKVIHDGVVMTDKAGTIQFINPAAATMTGHNTANEVIGLDYALVIKLESKEGRELSEADNPLVQAMKTNQPLEPFQGSLIVGQSDKRIPVAISVLPAEDAGQNRIITFRDITKELEEEGEQTEFISTASHEMRTPVATIDGYLSLCLNPQTATIDERAKGYLEAAQAASQHLGRLFQDLLDVTKLDDGHIKPHFEPQEMIGLVESISNDYAPQAKAAKLNFKFGSQQDLAFGESRRIEQVAYSSVDVSFIREIMDNLIENAIKYTPEGGSIYVNVRGDGDRVLINVTDTGMGISSDDLAHIFQKFYRADNSDTRTIGGTGLGLYLVKQRAEAMGGKVWAESAFGEGSTFYVSLPRISHDEYEKRMIAVRNQAMQEQIQAAPPAAAVAVAAIPSAEGAQPAPTPDASPAPAPRSVPAPVPAQPQPTPEPQPVSAPQPANNSQPADDSQPPQVNLDAIPNQLPNSAPISIPASQPTPPVVLPTPQPAPAPAPAPQSTSMVASVQATEAPPASPPPVVPSPAVQVPPTPTPPVQSLINNNLNGEAK